MTSEQKSGSKTYNMRDLADSVATQFDLTKQQAGHVTNFIFDKIKEQLIQGKQVRLHHFATLQARPRAAGVARNPSTGQRIPVATRRVVKMTVAQALKDQVAPLN